MVEDAHLPSLLTYLELMLRSRIFVRTQHDPVDVDVRAVRPEGHSESASVCTSNRLSAYGILVEKVAGTLYVGSVPSRFSLLSMLS